MRKFLETEPYTPPSWATGLKLVPKERIVMGLLPTPIHRLKISNLPPDVELWVKRDDMSGNELSGNKVRKLEFLMAEAKASGHDCVITIGGIQSNHCRATCVAARLLGMEVHLILRNSSEAAEKDPGMVGNVLLDRMVGAHIHQVTIKEYTKHGSVAMTEFLAEQLRKQGMNPFVIPVGGSNALGTWGYLECVNELIDQTQSTDRFTDVVSVVLDPDSSHTAVRDFNIQACGSGATVGGLALGFALSNYRTTLHSFGVCDTPEYFYHEIGKLFNQLGADTLLDGRSVEDLFVACQAKGAGYASSRTAELSCIKDIAMETGVLFDPVYSGKAMFGFLNDVKRDPDRWRGRRVLFIHTGGLLSTFAKSDLLQPLIESAGHSHRLILP